MCVLLIGSTDALALSIQSSLRQNSINVVSIDTRDLLEQPRKCFDLICNLDQFNGVLSWFLSESLSANNQILQDRLCSEWTALLAGALKNHSNVVNPPAYGMWNGSLPTYYDFFGKIDCSLLKTFNPAQFTSKNRLEMHIRSSLSCEFAHLKFQNNLPDEKYGNYRRKIIFIDDYAQCNDDISPAAFEDVEQIISFCRKNLHLRCGEIGITMCGLLFEVEYVLSRPQLEKFGFYKSKPYLSQMSQKLLASR